MFWVAGYCGSGCFWLFITRLYSSDLRLGWQNRILMTARAQCHRRIALDSHSLQSSNTRSPPSLSVLLIRWVTQKTIGNNSLVKLTFRFYFPISSSSHSYPPFDNIIRDMIQEIWMSSYGIRDHQTGISIVSANIGAIGWIANYQIYNRKKFMGLFQRYKTNKGSARRVSHDSVASHPFLRQLPVLGFDPAFNFLWPRQKWWV